MSWIEDNGLDYFDEDFLAEHNQWLDELRQASQGYIHTNIHGKDIDVRKIDKRYANNLINWYIERIGIGFKFSPMYRALKEVG